MTQNTTQNTTITHNPILRERRGLQSSPPPLWSPEWQPHYPVVLPLRPAAGGYYYIIIIIIITIIIIIMDSHASSSQRYRFRAAQRGRTRMRIESLHRYYAGPDRTVHAQRLL